MSHDLDISPEEAAIMKGKTHQFPRLAALGAAGALFILTGCQGNLKENPEALASGAQAAEVQGRYEEAVSLYDRASELGHAPSQLRLAGIYEDGLIRNSDGIVVTTVRQDRQEARRLYGAAARWYRQAAAQGDVQAQTKLAEMYYDGIGVTQNRRRALELYHAAAQAGNATAQYGYAYGQCWTNGRYEEALEWIRKSARQHYAPAQYLLAVAYQKGRGVEPDFEKAVEWLRRAAEQGHAHATHQLAGMRHQGLL